MKNAFFLFAILVFNFSPLFAQLPGIYPDIEWEKSFGSTSADVAYSICQTADSGYIVAGYSYSDGVIVPGDDVIFYYSIWDTDWWIAK